MNVCGVTFGGYLAKILSFKTGNLLNNSKFHLLSEGTVQGGQFGQLVRKVSLVRWVLGQVVLTLKCANLI